MIKVDLIAGFLGAGKTTFLLKYAKYLMGQGLHIGILVYDYGSVNVDMLLLNELRGEQCELEMVAAGCDADCLKRRFKTKLISMAMSGYDRVIIEPSGVFDMDMFYDTLRDEPLENWYEIGSVLTIVNAKLKDTLSDEENFILASQTVSAGKIIFSRMGIASTEECDRTISHIQSAAEAIGSKINPADIVTADWELFTNDDYQMLMNAGYHIRDYVKISAGKDTDFSSKCYLEHGLSLTQVKDILPQLLQSDVYGEIIRVKGFARDGEQFYQINASEYECMIQAVSKAQEALIIIGSNLDEVALDELMRQ